jgi:hypothetical protein
VDLGRGLTCRTYSSPLRTSRTCQLPQAEKELHMSDTQVSAVQHSVRFVRPPSVASPIALLFFCAPRSPPAPYSSRE